MPKKKRKNRSVSIEKTVDSVIVHDMKNLAFRLSALLQNMNDNYDNPLFKTSMMEVLGDTIRKMDGMVKRFREHQKQVVVKLRLDLNQLLNDLLERLPNRTTRKLTLETNLSQIPMVWADAFYLRDAFHSILDNAIEAMPEGGTLTVTTKIIHRKKRVNICVEISDTGVGMSQSFMESKLFSPFVSTKEQGLGLGLFTSQQIVALHHGTIEVESSPGMGTMFRIVLPAADHDT
jgi:signal transduction histidine kinase